MPAGLLAVPVAVLVLGAAVAWAYAQAERPGGRAVAAGSAWVALFALGVPWVAGGGRAADLSLGALGWGAQMSLHADAVTVAFGLAILLPCAVLLTIQRRSPHQVPAGLIAVAGAMLAVGAAGILLTAMGIGIAATFFGVQLEAEGEAPPAAWWGVGAAALVLAWAGVTLQVQGGTVVYSAVPVDAFTGAVAVLLLTAAVLCSGALPWRSWPARLWNRRRLEAGGLTAAAMLPVGLYLVARAYQLGAGALPGVGLNAVVSVVGAAVALGAGLRAQAAPTRRAFLAEVQPGLAGTALMAMGLGTAFGMAAAVTTVLAMGATAAILPLVPDRGQGGSALAVATAAGLPPTLVFGARLLDIQAAVEAREAFSFLALVALGAWLLTFAAGARALRLRPGPHEEDRRGSRAAVLAVLILSVSAGVVLGWIQQAVSLPAAAAVGLRQGATGASPLGVVSASGGWQSLTLAGPFVVLVALVALLSRRGQGVGVGISRERVEPILPALPLPARWWPRPGAALPAGLFDRAAAEAAMAGRQPLFWAVLIAAVTLAASR